jgi:hypothetical protein
MLRLHVCGGSYCIIHAQYGHTSRSRELSPDDTGEDGVYGQVADAEDVKRRQARVDARHLRNQCTIGLVLVSFHCGMTPC